MKKAITSSIPFATRMAGRRAAVAAKRPAMWAWRERTRAAELLAHFAAWQESKRFVVVAGGVN